jgi:hypothetical protein
VISHYKILFWNEETMMLVGNTCVYAVKSVKFHTLASTHFSIIKLQPVQVYIEIKKIFSLYLNPFYANTDLS